MTVEDDPTRVIHGAPQDWIPIPGAEGAFIKVLVADDERRQVVFMFRFAPGAQMPPHRHLCHATAYTISGEWEYEIDKLPVGTLAYEPVESVHTPSSGPGADLLVMLRSETDQFLENHMPDGSEFVMDMPFFKALEGATLAQAIERVQSGELKVPGGGQVAA